VKKRLDKPPCRVSSTLVDRIFIDNADRASREAIAREGLVLKRSWIGPKELFFKGEGVVGSPDFDRTLLALDRAGVVFQEDYKTVSPADLMRELQAAGALVGSFMSVGFDGAQWIVRDNPPGFVPRDND